MSYEPTGKARPGVNACQAEPKRIFTPEDLAKIMGVPRSAVPAHMEPSVRHGLVFRNSRHGSLQYAGSPFTEVEPPVVASDKPPAWVPPKMIATRPGSEAPRPALPSAEPPAQPLDIPRFGSPPAPAPIEAPAAAPAPTEAPAPAPLDPSEIDPRFAAAHYGHDLHPGEGLCAMPGAEPEPEPQEQVEPDAWLSVCTGEWVLVGCEVDEEGRVTVPAQLMARIKAQMVWSVAR